LVCNSSVGNYFLQNYKIRKYFLQNLLWKVFYTKHFAKKLTTISCNFFFITKFISISYTKLKKKLAENMSFFSSGESRNWLSVIGSILGGVGCPRNLARIDFLNNDFDTMLEVDLSLTQPDKTGLHPTYILWIDLISDRRGTSNIKRNNKFKLKHKFLIFWSLIDVGWW